jgi:hypothetical protein
MRVGWWLTTALPLFTLFLTGCGRDNPAPSLPAGNVSSTASAAAGQEVVLHVPGMH